MDNTYIYADDQPTAFNRNKTWESRAWKNARKLSSFFSCVPLSKHMPTVSRMTQTSRTRKKSSGISMEHGKPGDGLPSATKEAGQQPP